MDPDPPGRAEDRPGQPTEIRLPNGLGILVLPVDAPVTAVHLWLDAGSIDETAERSGIAHFLEHMAFKGTSRRGIGETAGAIEALGGDLNAFTSFDHTVLHAMVNADAWDGAIEVIADMVRTPRIDPGDTAREVAVVLEEIRGYEEDPEALGHDALEALLFPDHPYGRPVLGTPATVRALEAEAIRSFWRQAWGPARAWLAVVGPVDAALVRASAERELGAWTGGTPPGRRPEPGPAATERVLAIQRKDLETTALEIGWRTPAVGAAELAALDVAAAALGQGAGSILPVRLQLEDGIAAASWAELSARLTAGSLGAGWLPTEDRAAATLTAALEEIRWLADPGPSGRRIGQVKDLIAADYLFANETVEGIASDLLWYRARLGDVGERERYRRALAAVTAEEVRAAARRWLGPEAVRVVAVGPTVARKPLEKALSTERSRPVAVRAAGRVRDALPSGIRLVFAPDERSQVAAVRVVGLGGGLLEVPRTAGATNAWARMVTAGAGDADSVDLAEELDALGGVLEATAGRSSQAISATFPSSNLHSGLHVLCDLLVRPAFDAQDWERVQSELQEEVETLPDEPEELADQRIWAGLYPGHPWRLPVGGTVASVGAISRERLRAIHRQWSRASNLVICVAGGLSPDAVRDDLAEWLRELPAAGAALPDRPTPEARRSGLEQISAGHEQAHVAAAVRGPRIDHPDRAAFEVAAAVLSAQGGRLFLALREERGLAYSVWAESSDGLDGGAFAAGLSTAPERADEARHALVDVLARFAHDGPTDLELERCKAMMLGAIAAGLQRVAARAADLSNAELFGLPSGVEGARRAISAVDRAAVRRALTEAGVADPLVVVVRPP